MVPPLRYFLIILLVGIPSTIAWYFVSVFIGVTLIGSNIAPAFPLIILWPILVGGEYRSGGPGVIGS